MSCAIQACIMPAALPHPWKPGAVVCRYHAQMLSQREQAEQAYERAAMVPVSPQLARQMAYEAKRERIGNRGPDRKPRMKPGRETFRERERRYGQLPIPLRGTR